MSQETSGEKIHEPTPKRLEDARKRGDVARSDEVTTVAIYAGLLLAIGAGGASVVSGAGGGLAGVIGGVDGLMGRVLAPGGGQVLGAALLPVVAALAPVFLLPFGAALASLFAQRGIAVSGEKLVPKLNRVSPLAQLKQKFGASGLVEFTKRVVKMTMVTVALIWVLSAEVDTIVGAVRGAPGAVGALMAELLHRLLLAVLILAVAIAAVDLVWVRFDHRRKLMMTQQELRDETKESEGDPALKARRRHRATEIATNKMLAQLPKAEVVVVNPTHYAVALAWDRSPGSAPRC
ncbi:MAG: EscU/YscU/HrcU family type III secretion system export apparatus switch protein, partial [Pseudomonadota bacterium]